MQEVVEKKDQGGETLSLRIQKLANQVQEGQEGIILSLEESSRVARVLSERGCYVVRG